MVELNPPQFLVGQCYTWTDFRHVFNSIICTDGVVDLYAGDLLVTAAGGGSINVAVAAGSAWVEGSLNGAQGIYHVTNGASKPVTISANGAGSPRIDLVIASVYDSQYIGGVDQWALEVVAGVAGGGVPAVPTSTRSGYIILGEVTVPASGGAPSVVNDVRTGMSVCGTQPTVILRATAATSIPSNVETQIEISTVERVDVEFFDTSVPDQVTILQDGLYDIWCETAIAPGVADVKLTTYNDAVPVAAARSQASTQGWAHQPTQLSFPLMAGDFLYLWVIHQGVGAHDANDGRLLIRKVG